MTEVEAFLRAILEDPADDDVRLIYADWLEEHGHVERAEFLRLQISQREEGRQRELLARHTASWFRGLLPMHSWQVRRVGGPDLGFFGESTVPEIEWQVRRGFVQAVSLSLDDFWRYAVHLFRSQPVTRVTLTDRLPQSVGLDPSRSWFTCPGDPHLARFSYELPCCLEPFLGEPAVHSGLDPWKLWYYNTLEAAQAALSRACVVWGRHEAGLPPLPVAAYNPVADDSLCSEE
jgi:uncharacterized protein (TIGR02996 family)